MSQRASRPLPVPVPSSHPLPDSHARHYSGVSQRVAIEADVSLESDSHFFVDLTGSVWQGGLFLATWRRLPVGTAVDVVLSLPYGRIAMRGRVRWVRELAEGVIPGLGIGFEDLSPDNLARIEDFCAKRAPWYYDEP